MSVHKIEKSAILSVIGILILFSSAVIVVLIAPTFVDPSWTQPTNPYQVQIYEIIDPNLYISSTREGDLQHVYHIRKGYTLLAFRETEFMRIIASPELEKYVTRLGETKLKLTSDLLLLRTPENNQVVDDIRKELESKWKKEEGSSKPAYQILELMIPEEEEAFVLSHATDGIIENWVDHNFIILDESSKQPYHKDKGVIYVQNPRKFLFSTYKADNKTYWRYDPKGKSVTNLEEIKSPPLDFHSRQELIQAGEHIFAIEGCWYCHTDQTRTLIQDVVLNGSESFPAPPSSANEYIYQRITFPGTRRIGPDLSRVGIKRPNRDWHKAHFWSPKTESRGSIMPSFRHFFDDDPSGRAPLGIGIPNYHFEAIFQYLMTKGTRITPPTEAWWLGKDPVKTKEIIEGRRVLP